MLHAVYRRLSEDPSPAADAALVEGLSLGDADECRAVVAALVKRRRSNALEAAVAGWASLSDAGREAVVASPEAFVAAAGRVARGTDGDACISAAAFAAACPGVTGLGIVTSLLRTRDGATAAAAAEALAALAARCAGDDVCRDALENVAADALDDARGAVNAGRDVEATLATAALTLVAAGARRRPLVDLVRRRGGAGASRLSDPRTPADARAALSAGARSKALLAEMLSGAAGASFAALTSCADALAADDKLASSVASLRDGPWWEAERLRREIEASGCSPADAAAWASAGCVAGAELAELLATVDAFAAGTRERLHIQRQAARRTRVRGEALPAAWLAARASCDDPRVARAAARALSRTLSRVPAESRQPYERALLTASAASPVARRCCGAALVACFSDVWRRGLAAQPHARPQAARAASALLKLVPDPRAAAEVITANADASNLYATLDLADQAGIVPLVTAVLLDAADDADAKVRARAATLLGRPGVSRDEAVVLRLLDDSDSRVRANAVEALATSGAVTEQVARLIDARRRLGHNRERANAVATAAARGARDTSAALSLMLCDPRPAHRLSGVWAVGRTRRWDLLDEVGRLSRADADASVRRLAGTTVRRVAADLRRSQAARPRAAAAAAMLPATTLASADPFEALSSGFRGKQETPVEAGPWLAGAVMLVSGTAAVWLVTSRVRRAWAASGRSPAAFDRRTCRLLDLPRDAAGRLARLAPRVGASSAATLLACPSLLRRLADATAGRDRYVVELSLVRLAS